MASTAASVERARSVSSIRNRKVPPWWRANSQLNKAVRAPPIWRNPVGEGAKRVTTVIVTAIPIWTARMVPAHITHRDVTCTPAGGKLGSHTGRSAAQRVALGMAGWGVRLQGFRVCLASERERWILWAPVGIGLGVSCYLEFLVRPHGVFIGGYLSAP